MMKKLLSTILVLALALALALTLVSCGECSEHVDSDNDGKCDECDADYCAGHVDADKDGICDNGNCGARVPCAQHIDANGDRVCDVPACGAYATPDPCAEGECADVDKDGKCDVCDSAVEIYAADVFAMIADSNPTKVTTIHSVSVGDVPYNSSYITVFYAENHFSHEYTITSPGPLYGETPSVTEPTHTIVYKDGEYTLDGEAIVGAAPEVKYLNVKRDITPANVLAADDSNASLDKTGTELSITINAEQCYNTFGIELDAEEISLTIVTNGTRLSKITLVYETSEAVVTIETSYSYEPVAAPAA